MGGPPLWVKRDDCTGLGLGGNKVRKLEFALADAIAQGADTVVGVGVPQSNAVRQLAAAAAKVGLRCHLVLLEGRVPGTEPEYDTSGNVLLDELFGATLETLPWTADAAAHMTATAELLAASGARPYVVPYGVSSAVGALGYAAMVVELAEQVRTGRLDVQAVVLAAGSGGTQAGMVAAAAEVMPDLRIIGIDVDAEPERVRSDVLRVGGELARLAEVDHTAFAGSVEVIGGYAGPGYGVPTREMVEAVRLAARTEGLVLDPVYTGKAFAGFIDMVSAGEFDPRRPVVFVHTGGSPALFAYRRAFES
jgi:L-cysteate sulfo-lyase